MIDILLAALIGASVLFGFIRGFVGIVVGTLSWLLAGWAAFLFGHDAAQWWAAPAVPGTAHLLGGYLGVFVAVMVVVGLIGLLLKAMVKLTLLGGVDRLLGAALGLLRGIALAALVVLVAGYTPLPREAAWQQSQLRPRLAPVVEWMQAQVPELVQPLDAVLPGSLAPGLGLPDTQSSPSAESPLGKPGATGDNSVLGEVVAGRGWPRSVEATRDAASERATVPALPENIEPAPRRPDDQAAPARSSSPGQARPASL